jgi:hypothetical protein
MDQNTLDPLSVAIMLLVVEFHKLVKNQIWLHIKYETLKKKNPSTFLVTH